MSRSIPVDGRAIESSGRSVAKSLGPGDVISFESGSLDSAWVTSGNESVSNNYASDGQYSLQANSGNNKWAYRDDIDFFGPGQTMKVDMYIPSGANSKIDPGFQFGVVDGSGGNETLYDIEPRNEWSRVDFYSWNNGSETTEYRDSPNKSITQEWVTFEVNWQSDGDFDIYCYREDGTQFYSRTNYTPSVKHSAGGIGAGQIGSASDTNSTFYVDYYRIV